MCERERDSARRVVSSFLYSKDRWALERLPLSLSLIVQGRLEETQREIRLGVL